MSDEQTKLPDDDPRVEAWKKYTASGEYENTKRWAVHPEHVDGSLWAAFVQGWTAGHMEREE